MATVKKKLSSGLKKSLKKEEHKITKSNNRRFWDSSLHKSVGMAEIFEMYKSGEKLVISSADGDDITVEVLFKSMILSIEEPDQMWKILKYASK